MLMRHPYMYGRKLCGPEDLTPEEMAKVEHATALALPDIQQASSRINASWALVGGQALISYGVIRDTHDVDILSYAAGDLACTLVEDFSWIPLCYDNDIGDYVVSECVKEHQMDDPVLFDVGMRRFMFPLRSPGGIHFDLLAAQHPIEEEMIDQAMPRVVKGIRVPVAPLGGILLVKAKAGRKKDFAALEQTAENLPTATLQSAVNWAESRDAATTEELTATIRAVKLRMTPKEIRSYKRKRQ